MSDPERISHGKKLKLEVIRGGSGSTGRTAVGTAEPDDEPEHGLMPFPFWFMVVLPFARIRIKKLIDSIQSLDERKALLRHSKLNRRYRVILSQRWHFKLNEDFSKSDAQKLIDDSSHPDLSEQSFQRLTATIEERSIWHIRKYWSK